MGKGSTAVSWLIGPVTNVWSCLIVSSDTTRRGHEGFADSFAEDVPDAGLGFGDPVGPDAALVGLISQHHAHMRFG
jgi:hypothetical protein